MGKTKGFERESSLKKKEYINENYFSKHQLFSLSEQISLLHKYIKRTNNPKILEIGKGNGFVSDFFKKANFDLITFDINKNLDPDIVGNLLELNDTINFKSDLIICSEVLEHIEFEFFEKSLLELSKASKKYVIITLPEFKKFFGFNLQVRLPKVKPFSIPMFIKTRSNAILGCGHFWEIDYNKQTSRSSIEEVIIKYFTIIDKGFFHTNPYHNFYVLEVK